MDRKMTRKNLPVLILFITSFAYLYWFAAGIFFYQEQKSLFIFSYEYLAKHLVKPGGLLKYLAGFLTQGYLSDLYGAFINSLIIALLAILLRSVAERLSGSRSFTMPLAFLIPLGLMICQSNYHFNILHSLGFLLAAVLFLISLNLTRKTFHVILIFLFPVFYFMMGTYSLIYLCTYLIHSILYQNNRYGRIFTLLQIFISIVTLVLFYKLFLYQPFSVITGYPFISNEYGRANGLLYGVTVLFVLLPGLIKISDLPGSEKHATAKSTVIAACLYGISIIVLVRQYDPVFEGIMRTEKRYCSGKFDEIIVHHEKYPSSNIIEQFYYNLSLSEKGKLCDRMFFGCQDTGPMSLSLGGNREQASRTMHYYYAVGLVNEARHLAFELMVINGYSPENLKMLIKTELINGNFRVAERYLNILKKTLGYRTEAGRLGKMLENTELVNTDDELGEKRKLMPKDDFFIHTEDAMNIDLLLKSNPANRKAFEYKMARLLLEKDILAIAEESVKMADMGYTTIPRHIEEAIVAFASYKKALPDLAGLVLSAGTNARFLNYVRSVNSFAGDRAAIKKSLNRAEKDTFWYYLQFGQIRGDFTRSRPVDRNVY